MKQVLILTVLILWSTSAFGQEICFSNTGLKDGHQIVYSTTGSAVKGEFRVARDFDAENAEIYPFTGTVAGYALSIKFAGEAPDSLPLKPTTKKWTLMGTGSAQKLRVTLYGKNYNTNKWSNYTVDYGSCMTPYDHAAASAKRVTFAKGTTSATLALTFKAKEEKQTFLLGLRSGQSVSVTAPGCGISFFYPDHMPYEEGTAIDTWGSEKLPQTGDYLFVISPAGEPGKCTVKFEAR